MWEKFKKRLGEIKEAEDKKRVEEVVETPSTPMKVAKIIGTHLNREYKKTGSVDLVELITNSLDITIGIMIQLGINYEIKPHWEYYVELYNCCNHETFADVIAPDVKSKLLFFHKGSIAYPVLEKFTREEYEQATAIAVKQKKEDIMKFWNKYVENRALVQPSEKDF
ncbi:MAG: hypothetical protein V1914_01260 [archaeon]